MRLFLNLVAINNFCAWVIATLYLLYLLISLQGTPLVEAAVKLVVTALVIGFSALLTVAGFGLAAILKRMDKAAAAQASVAPPLARLPRGTAPTLASETPSAGCCPTCDAPYRTIATRPDPRWGASHGGEIHRVRCDACDEEHDQRMPGKDA